MTGPGGHVVVTFTHHTELGLRAELVDLQTRLAMVQDPANSPWALADRIDHIKFLLGDESTK